MRLFLIFLTLTGLTACKVSRGNVGYTRQEMLNRVIGELTPENGFTSVECESDSPQTVAACYVTNVPHIKIDPLLKMSELQGIELLQDWQERGLNLAKIYAYKDEADKPYQIGLLYFPIKNRSDKKYQNIRESSAFEVYIDKGN
ncbi:hypothetical protein [Deinococcus sp.]|uniref:hypothetical protein n=1 Tax=Deinococcus sp. TaxID=47478 RepID=UPI003B5C7B39